MSEMVERVANAIDSELCGDDRDFPDYRALARAAIKAMREPTLGMVIAGARKAKELPHRELADEYSAMIDEALK